jgi:hypothetical protein
MSKDRTEAEERPLPAGYRQGIITAITVFLSFSLLFMKFWVFEPSAVPWTPLSIGAAVLLAASVGCQVYALWKALQLADDMVGHYQRTLRWLLAGILFLICGLLIGEMTAIHFL